MLFVVLLAGPAAAAQEDFEYTRDYKPVVKSSSATDNQVRIEKVRRVKAEGRETERHGQSLKKRKATGGSGSSGEAKVYKRQRHFADRGIKLRSRSKIARKESLGISTE
jgi:hypothetical protein